MREPGVDEAEVWDRARQGEPAAWGQVYDLYRDVVFRQAWRWAATSHDAEDVMALVFLEAWRRRAHVRVVNGSIAAWLLVTTNHVAQNASRSARRHRLAMSKVLVDDRVDDHSDGVLDEIRLSEQTRIVREAFSRLKKPDQDVLTLCVINEYTMAHAAEALGVPPGTVKSRLSRAKSRLASLTGSLDLDDASAATLGGLS